MASQFENMTSRGWKPPIYLPPADPTLKTRPVPRERHFILRSFGPASSPETQQSFHTIKELEKELEASSFVGERWEVEDDAKHLFKLLIEECNMDFREDGTTPKDLTWGPTIIVTAYSEAAKRDLDKAITKLVEVIHRYFLRCRKTAPFSNEAFKRLRLDVIENQDLLENASDDRVREEFNAHIRALRLFPGDLEQRDWGLPVPNDLNRPDGPRRYGFCIVMDEQTMDKLAALIFPEDLKMDQEVLKDISIKVIDRSWTYPEEDDNEYGLGPGRRVYEGKDLCPILDLPLICAKWYEHAGLYEMWPLDEYREKWY
ncbi:hypothetical protein NW768_009949 [Fusarium equiseti]|uniref:Uncharacterized protein n=1 Tax=Fusarium equiseti TaxID=61235 RepID=A0ABQ8R237_FUSEQ|nr:hypothetical protein NW768_009949 [Fusarium equiseti]